jgi:peptidoglycan/LPS O-acetylase OafA/YrhL
MVLGGGSGLGALAGNDYRRIKSEYQEGRLGGGGKGGPGTQFLQGEETPTSGNAAWGSAPGQSPRFRQVVCQREGGHDGRGTGHKKRVKETREDAEVRPKVTLELFICSSTFGPLAREISREKMRFSGSEMLEDQGAVVVPPVEQFTQTIPQEIESLESKPAEVRPAETPARRCIELDGLRGMAAIFAVLWHYTDRAKQLSPAVAMFRHAVAISPAGMDMFFVLSGFLIGGILLKTRNSANYYKTFYMRRLHRIAPIYYLWVAAFGVMSIFVPAIRQALPTGYSMPMALGLYFLFLQNFAPAILRVIWLEATWSLAVEEHFYLFMPAIMRRVERKNLVQVLVGVVLISPVLRAALSVAFKRNGGDWGWWVVYGWTICRVDALALGVLLAISWANPGTRGWIGERVQWIYGAMAGLLATSVGFEALAAYQVRHTQAITDGFGRSSLELFSLCLVVIALANQGKANVAFMRWGWLREIGKISYCLYLTHWGIFWAVLHFGFGTRAGVSLRADLLGGVVALGLTLAVAEISWKFFEGPVSKRAHRYSY